MCLLSTREKPYLCITYQFKHVRSWCPHLNLCDELEYSEHFDDLCGRQDHSLGKP